MTTRRVAIVGAGIMGCSTALFLARRGVRVVVYDAAAAPFSGASRWNEGKIHLGFLYAGDPSFRTAGRILPGGLAFRPLLEELLGCPLRNVTETADLYLVHRESVVSPAGIRAYFGSLAQLIRSHPAAKDYLLDLSDARIRELSALELAAIANPESVVAGFEVPERSVSTQWVADRFVDSLSAEPGIELRLATRVLGVELHDKTARDSFRIKTQTQTDGGFDAVVNASWEGRLGIDATLGMQQDPPWSHRYRLSLFIETTERVCAPSAVICTGAFGDIKNYNGRQFYASWYPTGLVSSGEAINPPTVPRLDASARDAIVDGIFGHLSQLIPSIADLQTSASKVRLEGGWVFASGRGELADPMSTLHQRVRIGIKRNRSYFSVDTGKYSIAPWLALQVADAIAR